MIVSKIKSVWAKAEVEEKILFINFGALFLPFFVCAGTAACSAVYLLLKAKAREKITASRYSRRLFLFLGFALATAALNQNWVGLAGTVETVFFVLLSLYSGSMMTGDLSARLIRFICFLSLLCAAVAMIQKIISPSVRADSTFYNANLYGYICEMMILTGVYALLRFPPRPLYIATILCNVAALAAADCRSAWLAAVVGIFVIFLYLKRFKTFAAAAGVSALAAVLFYSLSPRLPELGHDTSVRAHIWETALADFSTRPVFGRGMLTYYFLHKNPTLPHAHNLLIEVLLCFGVAGFLLLLFYLVPVITNLLRNRRPANALPLAVVAATLIHGITDVPFLGVQTGLFLALLLSLSGRRHGQADPARRPR